LVLVVLAFVPASSSIGLDQVIKILRAKKKGATTDNPKSPQTETIELTSAGLNRRELIKNLITLPLLGTFVYALFKKRAWESFEEKHLLAVQENPTDAITSATVKTFHFASLKELKGKLPTAKIGNLEISRMLLGGNLIGGWAHARDLIYVSKLVKAYHSDAKVFDTLRLAELCGVNTLLTNPQLSRVINQYWRKEGGKIQFISDCGYKDDVMTGIKMSLDAGAHACYVQGQMTDRYVQSGRMDQLGKALEFIRDNKLPAGLGAHYLETIKACVAFGLKPDFWVKTLHHTNYWSASPKEECDNVWCSNPAETIDFMKALPQPWIAFKILAAGAIHPNVGFPYAFKNGADFICVGMYDFQVVEDVNLALEALAGNSERVRPWRA
jgi:hypothetical protein